MNKLNLRAWFDDRRKCLWCKLTLRAINKLPFVLGLSKDLFKISLTLFQNQVNITIL